MTLFKSLQTKFLSLDMAEADFRRRGFLESTRKKRVGYEKIGKSFISGFNLLIGSSTQERDAFLAEVECLESDQQGFFIEGAAMAAKIVDSVSPFSSMQTPWLFDSFSGRYKYLLHVGYGWAFARLPWLRWNLSRQLRGLDPVLKYLALDGYGFHEGYFKWRKSLTQQKRRNRLTGYQRNAFDQGLGRSLLFISGGPVPRVLELVSRFEANRLADIWSGIGLAVGYAGGVRQEETRVLAAKSEAYFPNLAQGVCFAAEARSLAGHIPEHTESACRWICSMPVSEATRLTRSIRAELDDSNPKAYAAWRNKLGCLFADSKGKVIA